MPYMPQSHSDKLRANRRRLADKERPTANARGYTSRWRRYRLAFLASHPVCACGCNHAATDVDHIIPVTGPEDPLFWDPTNHQALTHECHSKKTLSEVRERYYG